jgi:hypothetical protein
MALVDVDRVESVEGVGRCRHLSGRTSSLSAGWTGRQRRMEDAIWGAPGLIGGGC